MQVNAEYLNVWWTQKLVQNYGVQWKHIAAAQLLTKDHFPLLDLGAGAGVFLKLVEERFPEVNLGGVEISETAILNKVCESPITKGDIAQWRPTEKITTVSLIDVIEHIPDPEPLLRHAAEIADFVLIACPNFNFIKARLDVLIGGIPFQNRVARGGHVYWCEFNTLVNLFEKSGLSVIGSNHLYPHHEIRPMRYVFNKWPSVFAHEFVFILKKCLPDE